MPLPAGALAKVVFRGKISDTDDWSVGVWYTLPGGTPGQGGLDTAVSDLAQSFRNSFWAPASNPWASQVGQGASYDGADCYVYNGGVLVAQSSHDITPSPGLGGTPHPSYVACVVTLRTAGFGRRKRGRIYLPANGAAMGNTNGLFSGLLTQYLQNLALVLDNFGGTGESFDATPVVVSQTGGFATPITALSYDNKPDTQHGRENKTAATSTATVPIGG